MSLRSRTDSIVGIRMKEAQATKIATRSVLQNGNVVLTLPSGGVCNGTMVKFKAPCPCSEVSGGLVIDGTTYTVCNMLGACVTGVGGIWENGAEVEAIIDIDDRKAYLSIADDLSVKNMLQNHEQRIKMLEDFLYNDITGNPHSITFVTLDGLVVTGVWNEAQARLEC